MKLISKLCKLWRGLFHKHLFYIEDIERISPEEVICKCATCGETISAPYGLALPGELKRSIK